MTSTHAENQAPVADTAPFSYPEHLIQAKRQRDELYALALPMLESCTDPKVFVALLRAAHQVLKERDHLAEKLYAHQQAEKTAKAEAGYFRVRKPRPAGPRVPPRRPPAEPSGWGFVGPMFGAEGFASEHGPKPPPQVVNSAHPDLAREQDAKRGGIAPDGFPGQGIHRSG